MNLKKPPPGAKNKTIFAHQLNFPSWEGEASSNPRTSLEVFGGGSQTSSLLFSRTRSAWKDALQSAESSLQSTKTGCEDHEINHVVASVSDTHTRSAQEQVTVSSVDYSNVISTASPSARCGVEDDVSIWLANAETSGGSVKTSASSVSRSSDYGSASLDSNELNLEACTRRLSGCSVEPAKSSSEHDWDEVLQLRRGKAASGLSEVSDEALSARAAQWGYGVVLKPSDGRASGSAGTERISRLSWTTTGSSNRSSGAGKSTTTTSDHGSSAGSGFSSMIPGVSKNVKEALASFQLAFVVCDALNPEYPVLYASAGFFQMTGYSTKEVVGRNCRFLQGEYTDANDIEKIRGALKEGKVYTGKLLNYRKDGTPFWNMLTLSPIKDDEGRLIKYIGMQAEVTEGFKSKKDVGQNALPSDVKKFLETEGHKGTKQNPAGGSVVSAPSTPCKSSLDTTDAQQTTRPRYSLSSSRQSLEVSSDTPSAHDYQAAAAKLKAEVAALRAGVICSGGPVKTPESSKPAVEIERGCRTSRKSSKRTSGLIKLFKKLNGRFSLSKRGSRDSAEDDQSVVDGYYISDPDDEDLEYAERNQPRSSRPGSLTAAGQHERDEYCEVGSRRSSRRSSRVEERRECTSTSSTPENTDFNGESHTAKARSSSIYSSPDSGVPELPRSVVSYGRRSAQYPAVQASPEMEGLASERKDRRHSLATFPSAASSIKLEGKSQFCFVHPTGP